MKRLMHVRGEFPPPERGDAGSLRAITVRAGATRCRLAPHRTASECTALHYPRSPYVVGWESEGLAARHYYVVGDVLSNQPSSTPYHVVVDILMSPARPPTLKESNGTGVGGGFPRVRVLGGQEALRIVDSQRSNAP